MKNKLFRRLAFLLFFIFILNTAGSFFSWYTLLPWYDNMMHFLGGAWLGLVACQIFFADIENKKHGIVLVILFVFVGALLWEGLEYFVQFVTRSPGSLASYYDSISDLIFGLLGGTLLGTHTIKSIRAK